MQVIKYRLTSDAKTKARVGIVRNGSVHDLSDRYADVDVLLSDARNAETVLSGEENPIDAIVYLPPVPAMGRIFCVGLNYASHVAETGRTNAAYPSIFPRLQSAQVGHGQPVIRPAVSEEFDYEGELAVVIGAEGRGIARDDAMDHVAGYTCFAENSVRDWQRHAAQVTPGKNFDASGAVGPWVVTRDAAPAPGEMVLTTRLNGDVMQKDSPSNLIFDIPTLIAYISSFTRLRTGDLIVTGSPEGVGMVRDPQVWLKPGDVLEVEVSGIGTLSNTVAAQ